MPLTLEQSRRLARSVRLAAAALITATLAAAIAVGWSARQAALKGADHRLALLARVLEDQATRGVESAALVLRTLSEDVAALSGADVDRMGPLLTQALAGQPALRAVAVLDARGRVLASSEPRDRGISVDPALLGPLPAAGKDGLLPMRAGRSLRSLAPLNPAEPAAVAMLPLARSLRTPDGRELLLLALINPDTLANQQQTAIGDDPGDRGALLTYQGQLLAATSQVGNALGSSLASHPVFRERLAHQEHGAYVGPGIEPGGMQVVAYRASRSRPLVVLVEERVETALRDWRAGLAWLGLAAASALLLIVGAASMLLHNLRAREAARRELDRVHLQVALRERELSVLFKSVQELIFRTDAQGRLSFVNARWAVLDHGDVDQVLGRTIAELVEPEDGQRAAALFESGGGPGVRQAAVRLLTGDGRLRHFQIAVVPLFDRDRLLGFAGSAVDMTERVVAEQRLRQQLAFSGLLQEISPQPVSMVDREGRYLIVNRAWEDFTGRRRDDVIGRPMGFFMPDEERRSQQAQDATLLERGGRMSFEMRCLHRDGVPRDVHLTKVAVLDEQGVVSGVLCTLTDVTEFRNAERATLQARDAAEEASRVKSEFIANISHELRTPLQSILGFSELGLARGQGVPKLAAMFRDIHASGQRMLALVNDLLDVSKIESAVGTFHLERCDLRELVAPVVQELDPLLARAGLGLISRLPDTPLPVKADPQRLQQVLRNVLANAIKFSPPGSSIELKAGLSDHGEVDLVISDRGPGIPTGELEQIFDPFIQSSKTKDGSGGTGLGLAICRKILEIHGGQVHAQNRDGGGASFHIQLPLRQPTDTQLMTLA